MNITRKLAVAGVGILGATGLGVGVAAAQTSPSPAPPPAPAAPAPTPDATQQGDQSAPDTAAEKAAEATGAEKETAAEEPGDANLPGGGHADPAGSNVDTQFEGVQ
jgi:hypothetical protein